MKLRIRIMIVLGTLGALFLVTGSIGIIQLSTYSKRLDAVAEEEFTALKIANDFAILSARLEAKYIPKILTIPETAAPPVQPEFDEAKLQEYRSTFREHLANLNELTLNENLQSRKKSAIVDLEIATTRYLNEIEKLFAPEFASMSVAEKGELKQSILETHNALTRPVENVIGLFENAVARESAWASKGALRSGESLIFFMLISGCIALYLYRDLLKNSIEPVEALTRSARQIQEQNFESVLPVHRDDEIGELTGAFNDMSAELQIMKSQSDNEVRQLQLERKAIIDGFPYPIAILDDDGGISQMNPAAVSLLNDLNLEDSFPEKLEKQIQEAVDNDTDYLPDDISDSYLYRRNEEEYWYLPRIFQLQLRGAAGYHGWAVVLVDVTKVRWMDSMKNDHLATVSHELKTPITSIRMTLLLLSEQKIGKLSDKQSSIVESAIDDCERLLKTVESLLELTRLRREKMEN